ncbi:MAG: uroporphyrinogen-III C-methyltransferase [Candidatus Margulisiibacteriota bacterium]|nr:MAG: uroporphyrinogen-III C-methyltransferase [Candidatus Margulisbacteria bacterium GWD2_39_127]OGI05272.1 MAG: uroporphyrinogen-III C-methyltransferase [Candidatus Margulisbacteria bacterium GWF2_38_17]OGI10869.1 MAG: uroporphyrinogen-III C-methyltransferase [Candidatus Margulisbacteria bacterium GWE2_39_32]PZM83557.1 MAG: uroporphyrinogen-III C-methyltransferase [Candidatus Margulisiibacteriota bacterium]HAR64265.1 uroporphyrinogen-III C-methyltransferase [Candidatus Margulisiibacteriota 
MNKGKVYLIGAGPGDPELISMKAMRILQSADTVLYDSLANHDILLLCKPNAKLINVGKRKGNHSAVQSEINRMIYKEAKKANIVARLKGGDPFLFGRGAEEMQYLIKLGLEVEVIPGITSALAVPAYAGIPVTHRELSSSVALITGHMMEGKTLDNLKIPAADTIIVLMGISNLAELVDKLLTRSDFNTNTPAALIREGTLPWQKTIIGTLGNICKKKEEQKLTAPAIFVVGNVVTLRESLNWFESKPLFGQRIIVLRTLEQSMEITQKLNDLGATVVKRPIIQIVPLKKNLQKLKNRFLNKFTMIIFTSPNAVDLFMKQLFSKNLDTRQLAGKQIIAIGPKTSDHLKQYGIISDSVPREYMAEGILEMLPLDLSSENILLPRSAESRMVLPDELKNRQATVTVLDIYATISPDTLDIELKNDDYVIFTSSSTVRHFYAVQNPGTIDFTAFCIGAITAAELEKFGHKKIIVAKQATIDSLIDCILNVKRPTL